MFETSNLYVNLIWWQALESIQKLHGSQITRDLLHWIWLYNFRVVLVSKEDIFQYFFWEKSLLSISSDQLVARSRKKYRNWKHKLFHSPCCELSIFGLLFSFQRLEKKSIMMYKTWHDITPDYLRSKFVYPDIASAYRLRNTENHLVIPQPCSDYLKRRFFRTEEPCSVV